MIVPRVSRTEALERLRGKVRARHPILIASAGSGLVAKLLEEAGADCINTFHGARLRANGLGTMSMLWPIVDANDQVMRYTREDILPALHGKAFVCVCINANDPLRDTRRLLQEIHDMGATSVSNIGPSISYYDKDSLIYQVLTKSGITFDHEIEMLKLARQMDLLTIGLAFDEEDSVRMIREAGPDVFCFHAGTTKGGRKGFDSGETIEQTAARTRRIHALVRDIDPDVIRVAHGAAMETPQDAQFMLDHADCEGIWTGSSTERIPIENAVFAAGKQFASLRYSNT